LPRLVTLPARPTRPRPAPRLLALLELRCDPPPSLAASSEGELALALAASPLAPPAPPECALAPAGLRPALRP